MGASAECQVEHFYNIERKLDKIIELLEGLK